MATPLQCVYFVRLLKACTKQKNLCRASRIHADVLSLGLLDNCYIASSLINMYAKCGAIEKAELVLDEIPIRTVIAWNALIAGYVQYGYANEAIKSFDKINIDGLSPDAATFVCVLKACGILGAADKGDRFHDDIVMQGFLEKDVVVGTSLVHMYAKCGALAKAACVFDKLTVQNIFSWSALIAGYAQHDHGEEALECYEQMQIEGIPSNAVILISVLKACGSIGAFDTGKQIHSEVARKAWLKKDVLLATNLVDMYARCGAVGRAAYVLDELPVRDVVIWSVLIAGYAQQGQVKEALSCFKQMQYEGLAPNAITFSSILGACGSIVEGMQIHNEILRQELLVKDPVLGTALLDMYVRCGALFQAVQILDDLPIRNAITWNVLIAGYVQDRQFEKALSCFQHLQHEGLSPNNVSLIWIMKSCGSIGAVDKGRHIYSEFRRGALLLEDIVLGNAVVDMYVKCGDIAKAAEVLEKLPVRNTVTWNALIAGYNLQDEGDKAWSCFKQMQQEGLCPDAVTFCCALTTCGSISSAENGKQIHEEILRQGLLWQDSFLANALMDMYIKCGQLAKALQVFDEFQIRDAASWSVLIAGFAQQGHDREALDCFELIQCEGLSPDIVIFSSMLKVYGTVGRVDSGRQIHDEIVRQGLLGKDIVLDASLVDMYIRCGALAKAAEILDELSLSNIVTWNALIQGFVEWDQCEEALSCFEMMQYKGFFPDTFTFIFVLKACGHIRAIEKGEHIHKEIVRQGLLDKNFVLRVALVDMYAKCAEFVEAANLFDEVTVQSILCWNVLIAGYVQQGYSEEALSCLRRMESKGVCPDVVTYMYILKACGSIGAVDMVEQVHNEIIRKGLLGMNTVLGNALIDMYTKNGVLAKAIRVLGELNFRDTVSWNTLIMGYAQHGKGDEALKCLEGLISDGLSPDTVTLICILKACCSLKAIEKGEQVCSEIIRQVLLGRDVSLGNAMIGLYSKHGVFVKAVHVLDALNVSAWDVTLWNALIAGYIKWGQQEEALMLFELMKNKDICPDAVTFSCILKVCGKIGAVDKGEQIHGEIARCRLLEKDIVLGNSLIDMYAKCGAVAVAAQVLDQLPVRNVLSWNALIAGYAQQGQGEAALACLEKMQSEGLTLSAVTLSCMLNACTRSGLLEEGKLCFVNMNAKYCLRWSLEHCTSMVDLFVRAGQMHEGLAFINKMPTLDHLPLWLALLGSCQESGNVKIGKLAFDNSVRIKENDAAAYVLLSRVYG